MSHNVPPPGQNDVSEEDARAYLAQMRGAPVDQVVAEVLQGLLNAAQVKLGRNDARLLLDTLAAINDRVRGQVDANLTNQVDQALGQLRLAQVEAEREVASRGEREPNDLPQRPGGAHAGGPSSGESGGTDAPPQRPPAQGTSPAGEPSPLNKLWLPGR